MKITLTLNRTEIESMRELARNLFLQRWTNPATEVIRRLVTKLPKAKSRITHHASRFPHRHD